MCGAPAVSRPEGIDPVDWKPIPSIGSGCREIREPADWDAYRVVNVARLGGRARPTLLPEEDTPDRQGGHRPSEATMQASDR